jgi:hypothetical protein
VCCFCSPFWDWPPPLCMVMFVPRTWRNRDRDVGLPGGAALMNTESSLEAQASTFEEAMAMAHSEPAPFHTIIHIQTCVGM